MNTDRPHWGIAFNMIGLSIFAVQDVIVKLLSGDYPVFQIVFIRSIVAFVPVIIAIMLTEGSRGFTTFHFGTLILRGSLMFSSYAFFYLALAALPLAYVVSITFSAPLFVTALSVPLLRENVDSRRWIAVLVGFCGVLVMAGRFEGEFNVAVLLALGAALTYALSSILTRRVGASESGWTISFYATLVFGIGSSFGILFSSPENVSTATHASYAFLVREWILPNPVDFMLMALTGFIAATGHFCLAQAYRLAPASTVAPFEYSYFIWAAILGFLIWGEVPTIATIIGVIIVTLSGLYILRREMKQREQELK
ncbi:MAG: DMT family transporter [Gammaproteobacteria bacterium]|nr:DMT family transporter [Gammaproteobacteria bacterium]